MKTFSKYFWLLAQFPSPVKEKNCNLGGKKSSHISILINTKVIATSTSNQSTEAPQHSENTVFSSLEQNFRHPDKQLLSQNSEIMKCLPSKNASNITFIDSLFRFSIALSSKLIEHNIDVLGLHKT